MLAVAVGVVLAKLRTHTAWNNESSSWFASRLGTHIGFAFSMFASLLATTSAQHTYSTLVPAWDTFLNVLAVHPIECERIHFQARYNYLFHGLVIFHNYLEGVVACGGVLVGLATRLVAQVCKSIPSHAVNKDGQIEGSLNMELPAVVRVGNEYLLANFAETISSVDALVEKFKSDPSRNDAGRAHRRLAEKSAAELDKCLKSFLPSDYLLDSAKISQTFAADLVPTCFAVAKNRQTCTSEVGHLGSARLAGLRTCIRICLALAQITWGVMLKNMVPWVILVGS
jgi:hypothetical protein